MSAARGRESGAPEPGSLGSAERPLVVAVVGAGPAGFYAAGALLKESGVHVRIVLLERLPTPYGLVRAGVAPDHASIRRVTRVYDRTAEDERVTFLGNVTLGRTLSVGELRESVDAVLLSTGAEHGRSLWVPGAELPGVHSAAEFVFWYNGHPDYVEQDFGLDGVRRAVVVGNGNVAMDVARILARDPADLAQSDIAGGALAALGRSAVEEVLVVGRRGPAQAAFTPKEAQELGQLQGVDVVVEPEELVQDAATASWLASEADTRVAQRNLEVLQGLSQRPRRGGSARRLVLRFRASPVAFEAGEDGRVARMHLQPNRLEFRDGRVRNVASGEPEVVSTELVLPAIGYRSSAIEGLPFDEKGGIFPNRAGRVLEPRTGEPLHGVYVAGWAKRGPTGLIGTNKGDAVDTVRHLLDDLVGTEARAPGGVDLEQRLRARGARPVTWAEWQRLDAEEILRGEERGKEREKLVHVAEMLELLDS